MKTSVKISKCTGQGGRKKCKLVIYKSEASNGFMLMTGTFGKCFFFEEFLEVV